MIEFRYPILFLVYFVLAAFFLYRMFTRNQRKRELAHWGDEKLQSRLFLRFNFKAYHWKRRVRLYGLILLIFASTGPQIGTKLKEIERKGVDVILALDISISMNATDVKPSRLEKAKYEIARLISNLKGDRVGLIVFAGTSHLYLPLTSDYDAAQLFLNAVETGMIRTQGTAIAEAIEAGISAFPEDEDKYKVIVVVTDGEEHEGQALEVINEAVNKNIVIHSIGVGTVKGSLIPIYDEGNSRIDYKKDRRGKLVTTTLNERMLRELAETGRGIYIRFDNRFEAVDDLVKVIDTMEKKTIKTHEYSQFEDRYGIFLAGALFLIVGDIFISSRRKYIEDWRGRFV